MRLAERMSDQQLDEFEGFINRSDEPGALKWLVHLVAGVPNGLTVEYMPWTNRLFKETPIIADGKIEVPARPGLGLEFDEKVCAQYAV